MMRAAAVLAAVLLAGCNSFTVSQTNMFADEYGNTVTVSYGQLEKERKTEFVSPVNGKKLDMKSRLAVDVKLPSGEIIRAYQCMNMLPSGTMYKTGDGKWMFHANGTSCSVYLIDETGDDYLHVFRGLLSENGGRRADPSR